MNKQAVMQSQAVEHILRYPLDQVRERLLKEAPIPANQVDEAIQEFRRYLIVVLAAGGGVAMMSRAVDEVWHAFILFTQDYTEFTHGVFGRYLHHQPNTSATPVPQSAGKTFTRTYRKLFGEVPPIWGTFADCSGSTNCQDHDCISCRGIPKCHDKIVAAECEPQCEPNCGVGGPGYPCASDVVMASCVLPPGQCEMVCDSD